LFCHLEHGLGLRQYPSTVFFPRERNGPDVVRDEGYEIYESLGLAKVEKHRRHEMKLQG